jgi:uroporphyrinogen-III decarboxylase
VTSKDRILAAWNGQPADHVPLTTWCFGLHAPPELRWKKADGREVPYWYSLRMEHIHALPQPWDLQDEFNRVLAWRSLGVDDLLEVSVPWSADPEVTVTDTTIPAGAGQRHPVAVREYATPAGMLRHAVSQTGEAQGEGWVVQPDTVQLFEDLNIPRATEHAVSSPEDVPRIRHLFAPPDGDARAWFAERMTRLRAFAEEQGIAVQAWAAFGMDAAVWLAGTEGAVMMALDEPDAFAKLLDVITETDAGRVELAAADPAVDMIVQRGWYSGTDFWSPALLDTFLLPRIAELARLTHKHGKKFAYVVTTGVDLLGARLTEAGVDVLYFVDPVQDRLPLARARELAAGGMTVVGGTNAVSLTSGDRQRIRDEVRQAMDVLGPTHRFILHPVDALFPDTPWRSVEDLLAVWQDCR